MTKKMWLVKNWILWGSQWNQILKTLWGLESAQKDEENETKLNLLAQTISKWQLVEVKVLKMKLFKVCKITVQKPSFSIS